MDDLTDPQPQPLLFSGARSAPPTSAIRTWLTWPAATASTPRPTTAAPSCPTRPWSEQWTAGWTNFDPQNTDYVVVGVENEVAFKSLSQNYPNPFNPVTKIAYSIRQAGQVEITVHNTAGRVVRTLLSEELEAGATGTVVWDGMDNVGEKCASGVYFYTLTAPDFSETHKMVMLK
jgi:hypothetical protein